MKLDIFSRRKNKSWTSERPGKSGSECAKNAQFTTAQELGFSPPLSKDASPNGEDLLRQAPVVSEEASDARQERVAHLREQVRSGSYEIPIPQLVRILADLILRRR